MITNFSTIDHLEVISLFHEISSNGEVSPGFEDWRAEGVEALLLDTATGRQVLIEARPNTPLISELNRDGLLYQRSWSRGRAAYILRHEGIPQPDIRPGTSLRIDGLHSGQRELRTDALTVVQGIVKIKFL